MEALKARVAELEQRGVETRDALVKLSEYTSQAIKALHENGSEAEGRLAVFEAVTTALLAKSDDRTQRYAVSAVQVALEAYSDPEGTTPRNPEFLASFRQQAAHLFPDESWTAQ